MRISLESWAELIEEWLRREQMDWQICKDYKDILYLTNRDGRCMSIRMVDFYGYIWQIRGKAFTVPPDGLRIGRADSQFLINDVEKKDPATVLLFLKCILTGFKGD